MDAVLWDLDGTIAETRRDIATGVNLALEERGLAPLSVEEVALHVGRGSRYLMARCLEARGAPPSKDEQIERAYDAFRRHYGRHLLERTETYPGIPEAIDRLERGGVRQAVVTNKPEDLSRALLEGLGLAARFTVILGGDSLPERKPSALPLLRAIEVLGADPRRTLMVGDSEIDIQAARAAAVPVAAVAWGFLPRSVLLAAAPDLLFDNVSALEDWILGRVVT